MSKSKADAEKANQELLASLRLKIKDLEHEVATLKGRLDGLRKAKNTTITRREREVVEVGFKRDPRYEAKIEELERQLKDTSLSKQELEDVKKGHAAELEDHKKKIKDLQQQLDDLYKCLEQDRKDLTDRLEKEKKSSACNHEDELYKLKTKVAELEGDKTALQVENSDLMERVNSLSLELSVKEAKWCEKEEQYKLKLKQQWGDKYAEWMAETEKKIAELQEANQLLRMYLHRSGQNVPSGAGSNSS